MKGNWLAAHQANDTLLKKSLHGHVDLQKIRFKVLGKYMDQEEKHINVGIDK